MAWGQTDIGNKSAFGGITVEFYRDIAAYYSDARNWKHQKMESYFPDGQCAGSATGGTMWTFEPSAALNVLESWIKRDKLIVLRGEKLDRSNSGVEVKNGRIVSLMKPYGIDYGAIIPKRTECTNLLVPVAVPSSHIAFGSIRMEPVFFALGQAASTAAAFAIKEDKKVQDVNYAKLASRLIADGQVIR